MPDRAQEGALTYPRRMPAWRLVLMGAFLGASISAVAFNVALRRNIGQIHEIGEALDKLQTACAREREASESVITEQRGLIAQQRRAITLRDELITVRRCGFPTTGGTL